MKEFKDQFFPNTTKAVPFIGLFLGLLAIAWLYYTDWINTLLLDGARGIITSVGSILLVMIMSVFAYESARINIRGKMQSISNTIYLIGNTIGIILVIVGGLIDGAWHARYGFAGGFQEFFNENHLVLYIGITTLIISNITVVTIEAARQGIHIFPILTNRSLIPVEGIVSPKNFLLALEKFDYIRAVAYAGIILITFTIYDPIWHIFIGEDSQVLVIQHYVPGGSLLFAGIFGAKILQEYRIAAGISLGLGLAAISLIIDPTFSWFGFEYVVEFIKLNPIFYPVSFGTAMTIMVVNAYRNGHRSHAVIAIAFFMVAQGLTHILVSFSQFNDNPSLYWGVLVVSLSALVGIGIEWITNKPRIGLVAGASVFFLVNYTLLTGIMIPTPSTLDILIGLLFYSAVLFGFMPKVTTEFFTGSKAEPASAS